MSPKGMDLARADLDAGRLWKARDRLQGLLSHDPANQDVLGLLGQVCFDMADLPEAGRYWFLTERRGLEASTARDALHDRYGQRAVNLARRLPVRAPTEAYPPEVQERLRGLQREARQAGFEWQPGRRSSKGRQVEAEKGRWAGLLAGGIFTAFLGVLLAGLYTVGRWLVELVQALVE